MNEEVHSELEYTESWRVEQIIELWWFHHVERINESRMAVMDSMAESSGRRAED